MYILYDDVGGGRKIEVVGNNFYNMWQINIYSPEIIYISPVFAIFQGKPHISTWFSSVSLFSGRRNEFLNLFFINITMMRFLFFQKKNLLKNIGYSEQASIRKKSFGKPQWMYVTYIHFQWNPHWKLSWM